MAVGFAIAMLPLSINSVYQELKRENAVWVVVTLGAAACIPACAVGLCIELLLHGKRNKASIHKRTASPAS
jgi:hypothetical protein